MAPLIELVRQYDVALTVEKRDYYAQEIVLAIAPDLRRFIAVGCHFNDADTKDVLQETLTN